MLIIFSNNKIERMDKPNKVKKTTCGFDGCKKKLGICDMIINKCACEKVFCLHHKMPLSHDCKHDFSENVDMEKIKESSCAFKKIIKI